MGAYQNGLLNRSTVTGINGGSSPSTPKVYICEFCGKKFKRGNFQNHIRWTHKPRKPRKPSEKWLEAMHSRKGKPQNHPKQNFQCVFCKEVVFTSKEVFTRHMKYCKSNPNREIFKGHPQSEETKKKLSEIGLKDTRRRLMRKTIKYNNVLYDSSWEVIFAKRLEKLEVSFERPKNPLDYSLEGVNHHYFPDFWIPKIQKYVEVKNKYLYENDPKVKILKERSDIIWLTNLKDIENFNI